MGKLVVFMTILIIIDVLFLATGQLAANSPSSIVLNTILNLETVQSTTFWLLFLGAVGIAGLVATSGVSRGIFAQATNVLSFTVMAVALGTLIGDFLTLFIILKQSNEVLATIVMAPIIMIFIMTVTEWLRGKD